MATDRELSKVSKLIELHRTNAWLVAAKAAIAGMDAPTQAAAAVSLQAYQDPADTVLPHMTKTITTRIRDSWSDLWTELTSS